MRFLQLFVFGLGMLLVPMLASAASEQCLGCHDTGPNSPVHPLLKGPHGNTPDGCENCHGPSADHMRRPTIASPATSFGPRWGADVAEQNTTCINCHRDDVAAHWEDALHMSNQLTCVTCHDIHTGDDKPLNPHTQAEVCTTCHKNQKDGMHALTARKKDNPVCTTCHNPHGDQSPVTGMLSNRSEGCRTCHDLVAMMDRPDVSLKANSYHRVMTQIDRTCLDCHQKVAHGPPGEVEPFTPAAVSARQVALFSPGQSDIDWILGAHPGAQPFRQGTNCQQCHRGEEVLMGAVLGSEAPTSRTISLGFDANNSSLAITLSWKGQADDTDVAVMWGDGSNEVFRRGGCFAACHSDMPGMSRDRGLNLNKYLSSSRAQQQMIGQPPLPKTAAELDSMIRAGEFIELWRIKLQEGGKIEAATLLSEPKWLGSGGMRASAAFKQGIWTVRIERPSEPESPLKPMNASRRYTFGIAMHPYNRPGARHWVSLPMTFSMDGDDTDFRAD